MRLVSRAPSELTSILSALDEANSVGFLLIYAKKYSITTHMSANPSRSQRWAKVNRNVADFSKLSIFIQQATLITQTVQHFACTNETASLTEFNKIV